MISIGKSINNHTKWKKDYSLKKQNWGWSNKISAALRNSGLLALNHVDHPFSPAHSKTWDLWKEPQCCRPPQFQIRYHCLKSTKFLLVVLISILLGSTDSSSALPEEGQSPHSLYLSLETMF